MNEMVDLECEVGVGEVGLLREEERKHYVYMITSPSGKSYIGLTKNFKRRMQEHKRGDSKNSLVWVFVDKYGWDNLTKEILHSGLTLEEANKLEEIEILERTTFTPNGYNLTTGGDSFKVSQESIEKHRQSMLGYVTSEETKAKLSLAGKNRPLYPRRRD